MDVHPWIIATPTLLSLAALLITIDLTAIWRRVLAWATIGMTRHDYGGRCGIPGYSASNSLLKPRLLCNSFILLSFTRPVPEAMVLERKSHFPRVNWKIPLHVLVNLLYLSRLDHASIV